MENYQYNPTLLFMFIDTLKNLRVHTDTFSHQNRIGYQKISFSTRTPENGQLKLTLNYIALIKVVLKQ